MPPDIRIKPFYISALKQWNVVYLSDSRVFWLKKFSMYFYGRSYISLPGSSTIIIQRFYVRGWLKILTFMINFRNAPVIWKGIWWCRSLMVCSLMWLFIAAVRQGQEFRHPVSASRSQGLIRTLPARACLARFMEDLTVSTLRSVAWPSRSP